MSHLISKFMPHFSRNSKFHRLLFIAQYSSIPLELNEKIPLSKDAIKISFTVKYFVEKCGFSPENALLATNYAKFDKSDKPDACLAFLKKHGFTDTQLFHLLRKRPRVINCNTEKTLLPKIEFLRSKGLLDMEIAQLLVVEPSILLRSLEKSLVPTFELIKCYLGCVENTVKSIKRCPMILPQFQTRVLPNIRCLKVAGVPDRGIAFVLRVQPSLLAYACVKTRELVEVVKGLGFEPCNMKFVIAFCVKGVLSKLVWDKKLETYQRWECSEKEVLTAFRKAPWSVMKISVEKIDGVMDFFVNEMGWRPQMLLQTPQLFSTSLHKRIIPRCSVYKVLLSKGLLKKKVSLSTVVQYSDDEFLEKFITCYPEEAPNLLRLHEEKMKIPLSLLQLQQKNKE